MRLGKLGRHWAGFCRNIFCVRTRWCLGFQRLRVIGAVITPLSSASGGQPQGGGSLSNFCARGPPGRGVKGARAGLHVGVIPSPMASAKWTSLSSPQSVDDATGVMCKVSRAWQTVGVPRVTVTMVTQAWTPPTGLTWFGPRCWLTAMLCSEKGM